MFNRKIRATAVAGIALTLALVATGCAPAGDTGGDGGDANYSITFLPKNLGNAYFDTSDAGGAEAIDEFGGTYAEVGPATATPDSQVSFINTAAQQGVGALDFFTDAAGPHENQLRMRIRVIANLVPATQDLPSNRGIALDVPAHHEERRADLPRVER